MWHTVIRPRDFHCAKLSFSSITTEQMKLWVEQVTSLNRLSPLSIQTWQKASGFLELNSNLVFSVSTNYCWNVPRGLHHSRLVTEADVDNEYKVEQELTWLRDNHSKSAGSNATITVCLFVCLCAHRSSWSFSPSLTWLMLRHVGNARLDITRE